MDLKSKLMQCFDHWTDNGYTVTVKPWTPITNRRGQTTQQATVIVEGLVPSGQGSIPGPYLDARVTVSYDTEDRRIEVDMTVDNKCDSLTLGCNGESVAEHILTTMSRHISSRDVRHQRCFDLALQLVESINSNYGPNAY